jgi:hypothetical protein
MALAAFGRHIRHHDVLTVSLAAVLGHLDTFSSPLETGEACPRQKSEQDQDKHPLCPEAMSLEELHIAHI